MKLKDIAEEIITGVLTKRVVWEGEGDASSSLEEGKILVPKSINAGIIDHSLLQLVKLEKQFHHSVLRWVEIIHQEV